MKLSRGDKAIGISFYAESSEKPLSVTLGKEEDRSVARAELHGISIWHPMGESKEAKAKRHEEEQEAMNRPCRYKPEITIGLGLDRETTTLSRDDFEALVAVIDAVRDEIKTRDVEVERYEREQKAKKAAE